MVAQAYGKTATFMPKPVYNDNGSGMHVHQSIWSKSGSLFAGKEYHHAHRGEPKSGIQSRIAHGGHCEAFFKNEGCHGAVQVQSTCPRKPPPPSATPPLPFPNSMLAACQPT